MDGQGGKDAFIRKYDVDGDIVWTNQFGSPETDEAHGVASVDDVGSSCPGCDGVYVVGWTVGVIGGAIHGTADVAALVRQYQRDTGFVHWTEQTARAASALAVSADPISGGVWGAGLALIPGKAQWDAMGFRAAPPK
jgi:hypothetical protein